MRSTRRARQPRQRRGAQLEAERAQIGSHRTFSCEKDACTHRCTPPRALRGDPGDKRLVGSSVLIVGEMVFAVFYGWFTLMFLRGPFLLPDYTVFTSTPFAVNLFFPLFGFVLGLCQGVFISLIDSFAVADHHPDKSYRQGYSLVASLMIGHCVYGTLVMLLQSVLLA